MGSTCNCQQRIDEDEHEGQPQIEEKNDEKQPVVPEEEQKGEEQQRNEQQTVEKIDPIQLKSYEIEDNCPQGLKQLTIKEEQEFLSQFSDPVKKVLKKLPKLKIQSTLSPNYLKIPHIDTPYELINGDVYVGQWAEGKPYGIGTIYYMDKQIYEGQVIDGIPDGEGRKIFNDGSIYTGMFKMGEITGKGKYEKGKNGFKYEGDFLNGKPHGLGTETWPDFTTYSGQFVLGIKQGRGTFTWGNGQKRNQKEDSDNKDTKKGQNQNKKFENYCGEFQNNLFHGQGVYEWKDGRMYEGEWAEGKMEGKGEFIWPGTLYFYLDKRKYVGGYLKDMKSGYGVLEWPDGKKLAGYWRLGKLNGMATLTIRGKLLEDGKEREPDKTYLSEWEDGKRIRWVNNQQPSGMHSNVSYQRYFDEHQQQQQNTSQLLPSQIDKSQIQVNDDQQQKTVFQTNAQKQTQDDSLSQQQQLVKQSQAQKMMNNEKEIQFQDDNQFDQNN